MTEHMVPRELSQEQEKGEVERPFVAISVATLGEPRSMDLDHAPNRYVAAGNMSVNYAQPDRPDITGEERARVAVEHANEFVERMGLKPENTVVLLPQKDYKEPLGIIDVDQEFTPGQNGNSVTALEERADFIFTHDPEKVLACRPADCPVLVGRCIDGSGKEMLFLGHFGWQGENAGYLDEALAFLKDAGVDPESVQFHITPGIRRESFAYKNDEHPVLDPSERFVHPDRKDLFVDIEENTSGTGPRWEFNIDMFGFMRKKLKKFGARDKNIFEDTTDTGSLEAGTSSHARAVRLKPQEVETRDMVVATMTPGEPKLVGSAE